MKKLTEEECLEAVRNLWNGQGTVNDYDSMIVLVNRFFRLEKGIKDLDDTLKEVRDKEDESDDNHIESDIDYLFNLSDRLREITVICGTDGYDADRVESIGIKIKVFKSGFSY